MYETACLLTRLVYIKKNREKSHHPSALIKKKTNPEGSGCKVIYD
jgi:hypothetical protein